MHRTHAYAFAHRYPPPPPGGTFSWGAPGGQTRCTSPRPFSRRRDAAEAPFMQTPAILPALRFPRHDLPPKPVRKNHRPAAVQMESGKDIQEEQHCSSHATPQPSSHPDTVAVLEPHFARQRSMAEPDEPMEDDTLGCGFLHATPAPGLEKCGMFGRLRTKFGEARIKSNCLFGRTSAISGQVSPRARAPWMLARKSEATALRTSSRSPWDYQGNCATTLGSQLKYLVFVTSARAPSNGIRGNGVGGSRRDFGVGRALLAMALRQGRCPARPWWEWLRSAGNPMARRPLRRRHP